MKGGREKGSKEGSKEERGLCLYYLGKKFIALLIKGRFMGKIIQLTCPQQS